MAKCGQVRFLPLRGDSESSSQSHSLFSWRGESNSCAWGKRLGQFRCWLRAGLCLVVGIRRPLVPMWLECRWTERDFELCFHSDPPRCWKPSKNLSVSGCLFTWLWLCYLLPPRIWVALGRTWCDFRSVERQRIVLPTLFQACPPSKLMLTKLQGFYSAETCRSVFNMK